MIQEINPNLLNSMLVEKYRPFKVDDLILEDHIESQLRNFLSKTIETDDSVIVGLPSLIFEGVSGIGKTSTARTLCKELKLEYMFVPSLELSKGSLQDDLKKFAETASIYDFTDSGKKLIRRKVIIIDEVDSLSMNSSVPGHLKSFIEAYSNNCTFIFTCNEFESISNDIKIKDALKSRCQYIDFNILDKKEFSKKICQRLVKICDQEGIKYTKKNIVEIVKHHKVDIRKMINFIDQHSYEMDTDGVVYKFTKGVVDEVMQLVKEKQVNDVIKWVNDTSTNLQSIFKIIYENYETYFVKEGANIPTVINIIEHFMDKLSRSIFPEITVSNFLLTLAKQVKMK